VEGERLWQRFTAKTKALQLWYYDGLAKRFTQRARALKDPGLTRMAKQLRAVVEAIRAHEPQPAPLQTSRQGDRQRTEVRTRDGSRAVRSMRKK
jgi:hypothetical protein